MTEEEHAELYTQLFALAQMLESLDAEFATLKVSSKVEFSTLSLTVNIDHMKHTKNVHTSPCVRCHNIT